MFLIVALLWGTLLPFMSGTSFGTPNKIEGVSTTTSGDLLQINLKFTIDGYFTLYSSYTPKTADDIKELSDQEWRDILDSLSRRSTQFKLVSTVKDLHSSLVQL